MKRTPLRRGTKQLKRSGFKKKPRKILKKKRLSMGRTWKKMAWEKFSEYVRRKADGVCFTCGAKNRWQDTDASHFIHDRLDFDERNIHCCCRKCNRFMHGNLGNYALHLMEEIGIEEVNKLRADATLELGLPKKTAEYFKEIHDKYESLLKEYKSITS